MQFNQAQLRDILGISVETFRHWKLVLPPFSERKKYTLGDLLAAGVLRRMTDQCGIRAGQLREISGTIVEVCNGGIWASLKGKTLVIDLEKNTCALVDSTRAFSFQDIVVVCRLEKIMAQIQETLSRNEAAGQHALRFPPVAISNARAQRRRA